MALHCQQTKPGRAGDANAVGRSRRTKGACRLMIARAANDVVVSIGPGV